MRRLLSLLPLALAVLAAGCENVQSPGELTLQTRNALDVLPADVAMVSMVNVERARASDAFESFTEGGFSVQNMTGEGAARFNDLIEATGFNPEEDLERVYFAARNVDGEEHAPSFVVYADYDRARLDAYLDDQPDLDLERTTYADTPVYVTRHEDDIEMAVALVNDEMIVAGGRPEVYAMLDRIADGSPGLSTDADMMALIRRAAHPDDMWMALRDLSHDGAHDRDDAFEQAGRMVQNAVVSAGFQRDGVAVEAVGVTREGVDTGDVADLVRGAVATMKMGAKSDRAALETLDRVDVREVRDGIEVETFVSQEALRSMRDGHDI
jgi:hypothetical protein